ncbi:MULTISPECIES: NAD-dependent epimerase/dehydratase family protein [Mycobacteriaceae]|uniref:NAD(P)H-binding protein n=1 Tax=Mycolicibacterium parafortuitum TaxID=39692 RepID=A0ACC6MBI2_MYCPF|nr:MULTISPECIES: NAD-dependent epimerase/dehydratase family protein [Mycobacteriaceae]MDZ5084267.1 NAD(P)H-binding protein [Mycolicibacterium parafortuitum]GFM17712.1 NAD-dependent epimerase/dehydratase [Mycobacterium sp. PO1]GFM24328.1 NAD-dependent epimerase/dehydratase [Mycobacterium sp. PO2]
MSDGEVLVTGGSGYLAAHAIAQLLARGHAVRTTVRSLEREVEVRAMVAQAGVDPHGLQVLRADLMNEDGWAAAASGVEHVLHVASPFPAGTPRTEDDVIVPAREGTLRVLRAARAAGVKRVVLTSSFAAIGYGHNGSGPFGEDV